MRHCYLDTPIKIPIAFQIIEMPGRVVAFGQAPADKFPKDSIASHALAAIQRAVSKA
jgi:hypothetical protein